MTVQTFKSPSEVRMIVFNPVTDERRYFEEAQADFGCQITFVDQPLDAQTYTLAFPYDVILTQPQPISHEMIDVWVKSGVQLFHSMSVGLDHMDVEYATNQGLMVSSAAYSPESVGEFSVMLALLLLRQFKAEQKSFDNQDYRAIPFRARELRDCVVGIYGTGRIGQTAARLFCGMGARVIGYDPYMLDRVALSDHLPYLTFVTEDDLLAQADIISLHCPSTPQTRGLVDKKFLAQMRGDYLINTGRGDLVVTSDLIEALSNGSLLGAGLDVLDKERGIYFKDLRNQEVDHPHLKTLHAMPNVILTPHMAYCTHQAAHDYCYGSVKHALEMLKVAID